MSHPTPLFQASSIERQFAHELVRRLHDRGFTAYYAGGCVRDALLGIQPKDFDVATNATPEQVRGAFGESHTQAVGEAFGVILVQGRIAKQKCQVEVATFRTDGSYSDGRRPDWVEFATAEQDAQRRDFTINGLFYDPLKNLVIDFVGGQADLQAKTLRAIGNPADRIREDRLRMLRAVRFAARYEFEIDPDTLRAIIQSAPGINLVSGERIGNELTRILEHPNRNTAWQLLNASHLNEHLAPEIPSKCPLFHDLPKSHCPFPLVLASLLHPWCTSRLPTPISRPSLALNENDKLKVHLAALRNRWKLSNAVAHDTLTCINTSKWMVHADLFPWSAVQPNLLEGQHAESLVLAELLCSLHNWPRLGIERCTTQLDLPVEIWNPPPLLLGEDLIQAGLKPSPLFGKLLQQSRALQLDQSLISKDQALAWLHEQIRNSHERK